MYLIGPSEPKGTCQIPKMVASAGSKGRNKKSTNSDNGRPFGRENEIEGPLVELP